MRLSAAISLVLVATAGVAVGVDYLTRTTSISLGTLLLYRGLIGILLLLLWHRPSPAELRPREPRMAIARLVAAGLTFVGWFGAIAFLSAPFATALLLLDSLVLELVKSLRDRTLLSLPEVCVFSCVIGYVGAVSLTRDQLSADFTIGIALAVLAIGARTISMEIWARSCEQGEAELIRIFIPLLGGALTGLVMTFGSLTPPSFIVLCLISATAALGLLTYLTEDQVILRLGAFRTRLVEIFAVPLLAVPQLFSGEFGSHPATVGFMALLAASTLWAIVASGNRAI